MRLIGKLEDEDLARTFSDYLTQLDIDNQIAIESDGTFEIWVISEDDIKHTEQLLSKFLENPDENEYKDVSKKVKKIRKQLRKEEKQQPPRVDVRTKIFHKGPTPQGSLTLFLIIISAAVSLFSGLGENFDFLRKFLITDVISGSGRISWLPGLREVANGEVWRLITPIFILVIIVALGLFNCGKTEVSESETGKAETKTVKCYTIEQFMDTISIDGSSFSHDESTILFTSNKTGIYNAYTIPVTGGEAKQLTFSKKETVYARSYFPKDSRFLFTSDKGGNEITHIFVRNEDGTEKDLTPEPNAKSIFYGWSFDQKSFFFTSNKRDPKFMDLYEMDIETFTPKMIFENKEGFSVGTISNDKKYIALGKTITNHDSDIYLFNRETKELKHITPHEGEVRNSPSDFDFDSKELYYLTDENSEFRYLKSYDISTGKSEKILEKKWDIWYAYFSRNGKYRVIGVNNDGRTQIEIYDTKAKKLLELPEFPNANITSINISNSEKLMTFYSNGYTSPNNLFIFNMETGEYKKLTDSMNPEINENDLVNGEIIRYKSFDNLDIPAIYYKPKNIDKNEKIPALISVHGGPGGQSRVGYRSTTQYFVNHGYAVLAVNNRGSTGYGKTFFKLDDMKHGEDDLRDCVEAKKFLESTGYIDEDKIGIIGGSYGGYMVLAGLVYTPEEFAVGVDIFGVANWLRTLKSIPPWWESFKKALYKELGNPETDEAYLKKISPLFHAEKITKPLIVLQGANDPRVLKVESDEIVAAVKKNKVPVEYIVFDDEGHGFKKKKNRLKAYKAILQFLDKYLKQKKETYIY